MLSKKARKPLFFLRQHGCHLHKTECWGICECWVITRKRFIINCHTAPREEILSLGARGAITRCIVCVMRPCAVNNPGLAEGFVQVSGYLQYVCVEKCTQCCLALVILWSLSHEHTVWIQTKHRSRPVPADHTHTLKHSPNVNTHTYTALPELFQTHTHKQR